MPEGFLGDYGLRGGCPTVGHVHDGEHGRAQALVKHVRLAELVLELGAAGEHQAGHVHAVPPADEVLHRRLRHLRTCRIASVKVLDNLQKLADIIKTLSQQNDPIAGSLSKHDLNLLELLESSEDHGLCKCRRCHYSVAACQIQASSVHRTARICMILPPASRQPLLRARLSPQAAATTLEDSV